MSDRLKLLLSALALTVSFAFGRYSVHDIATTKEATSETEVKKDKDTHKETTTVKVKTPDGTETTTTKTTEDTRNQQETRSNQTSASSTTASKTSLNISVLGAVDTTSSLRPLYGLSVSKEVIGPITAGVFGLNNGMIGISIGVNF